jgi:ubiquinone/menaquinone biosynthesis C-methylase UbiE
MLGAMTFLRDRLFSTVAGQLGRPHGILSPFVARALDRGNQKAIVAAVDATQLGRGGVAADVGFGGGLGLQLLLDRVGDEGVVHGIEIADDMLRRARTRFRGDARLRLSSGSLTELPLDDGSIDALITVNTVYFISALDAACDELARVMRPGGQAVIGIGDPDVMARMPFTKHGFTIRPVDEIAATLQNSGLRVAQRRIDDKPIPRYLVIGTRA